MKEKTIKIFAMRVSENRVYQGRIEELENTLKAEQEYVGGLITVVGLTNEIDIVANDEGKLEHLPPNRIWRGDKGNILDMFVGNIYACRYDDEGNFTSIHEDDIPVIIEKLPAIQSIINNTVFLRKENELPEYGSSEWKLGEKCFAIDMDKNIVEVTIVSKLSNVLYGVMDKKGTLYHGETFMLFRSHEEAVARLGGCNA